MADCLHEDFRATVSVGRLTAAEGEPVTGYAADIRVECAQCGAPFEFMGLPMGSLPGEPTTDVARLEARMPIRPAGSPEGFGLDFPGFTVRRTA